jgi:hypothetical protein
MEGKTYQAQVSSPSKNMRDGKMKTKKHETTKQGKMAKRNSK